MANTSNKVKRTFAKKPRILEYYRSLSDAQWYCRIRSTRNGNVLWDGSEAYKTESGLIKSKMNDPMFNFDFIEVVKIEDPHAKKNK